MFTNFSPPMWLFKIYFICAPHVSGVFKRSCVPKKLHMYSARNNLFCPSYYYFLSTLMEIANDLLATKFTVVLWNHRLLINQNNWESSPLEHKTLGCSILAVVVVGFNPFKSNTKITWLVLWELHLVLYSCPSYFFDVINVQIKLEL